MSGNPPMLEHGDDLEMKLPFAVAAGKARFTCKAIELPMVACRVRALIDVVTDSAGIWRPSECVNLVFGDWKVDWRLKDCFLRRKNVWLHAGHLLNQDDDRED